MTRGIGNDLVREARRRAGLSQRQLAERAGTTQSALARLESGRTSPSFDNVLRLVRLCGLDLDVMLVERDDSDWAQAQPLLRLTPDERARRGDEVAAKFRRLRADGTRSPVPGDPDFARILRELVEHDVRFVLIGGLAAVVHGSIIATEDVDVTVAEDPDNTTRLGAALASLRAVPRTGAARPGRQAAPGSATARLEFATAAGDLDIIARPTGTEGFLDLVRDATVLPLYGVLVPVASLADVIRSKQAANRPKDQRVLPVLREILAARHDRKE